MNEKIFGLNDQQIKQLDKWDKKHKKCKQEGVGAIGGRLSYTFIPLSIGTIVTVKCAVCEKEINLNSADEW